MRGPRGKRIPKNLGKMGGENLVGPALESRGNGASWGTRLKESSLSMEHGDRRGKISKERSRFGGEVKEVKRRIQKGERKGKTGSEERGRE